MPMSEREKEATEIVLRLYDRVRRTLSPIQGDKYDLIAAVLTVAVVIKLENDRRG